jgi:hypothetical protein
VITYYYLVESTNHKAPQSTISFSPLLLPLSCQNIFLSTLIHSQHIKLIKCTQKTSHLKILHICSTNTTRN